MPRYGVDMSGGSVPLWITVVLAIIALLGPWGGAWLASRRDDRRWERDQAREDVRSQREREREDKQRGYQTETARREEKKQGYTEFLSTLMTWGWLLDRAGDQLEEGVPIPSELVVDLENAKILAVKAYAGLLVVADKEARREIEYGFYDHMEVHGDYVISGKSDEANYHKLNEAQDWVRRRARHELGIYSIADPDPSP
jgi:hypothetical protein